MNSLCGDRALTIAQKLPGWSKSCLRTARNSTRPTTLTFQAVEEDTADEDLASIRTTANRIMEAHEKTAGTSIATGKELLKATLVKDTPRGDNTRIGWVKGTPGVSVSGC